MSHHLNLPLFVCSANENHFALRMFLIVQLPITWKFPACGCCITPACIFCSCCFYILRRLLLYSTKIHKMKSLPDTTLPSSVVIFYRCLEARLVRRYKYRNDT